MQIRDRKILLLGGSGLVGMAVARELMPFEPASLVLSGLTQEEAEAAAAELREDPARAERTRIDTEWGDIFQLEAMREMGRGDVVADTALRARLLDDLYGELNDEVLARSTLGSMLDRLRPDVVIDCINTATAFAYQNIFESAAHLRGKASDGGVTLDDVERHLATLYMPQLIRHVQIALEGMRRAGTSLYLKVGTAGTGGMGLNVPFTHSEERPSRMLLAKAGIAGAHTLLLFLMARTPDAPAVKEIKPTAAISWKRIAFGEVTRRGRAIPCQDATRALPLDEAFTNGVSDAFAATGEPLRGVYLDAGENGLFSLPEFETLTALGLMEYITPEEIAESVVREVRGHPTGRDVVAALDAATSGPTYRAGVLRQSALDRMALLEREHGVESVAYEMLGPPRLSKLLFEGAILGWLFDSMNEVAKLDAEDTAKRAESLVRESADLRVRILTIGLPILLADGDHVLRGPDVKVPPAIGQNPQDARLPENGWVDLRPSNWRKWSARAQAMLGERRAGGSAEEGSRSDIGVIESDGQIRPGRLAAWVFRREDRGARIKR
jgi:NAD(P)-dependent dehydrogenase (short-subunit alcohol dehydrogenase family)